MIRTFVAIEIPEALRRSLGSLQETLKRELSSGGGRGGREQARIQWTRPESLHVTLKFLGDIDDARVEAIREALAGALVGHAPFTVEAAGVGMFPDERAPRIIWAGLRASAAAHPLTLVAAAVERALEPLGFPREGKPFHPHLTLARVKDGGRIVAQALRASGRVALTDPTEPFGTMPVEQVALMRSDLRPTGSIYTRLLAVRLEGGPK